MRMTVIKREREEKQCEDDYVIDEFHSTIHHKILLVSLHQ